MAEMPTATIKVTLEVFEGLLEAAKRTEPDYAPVVQRLASERMARLLHVAIGLVTESAEFLDQLKKHLYYGKPLDTVNLSEEMGDITWYQRLGAEELETTLLGIMQQNVAKLRARFPQKFEESQAITRDLGTERAVLEAPVDMDVLRRIADKQPQGVTVVRRNGSGPLPGHDVTVVQTGEKTVFIKSAEGNLEPKNLDAQGRVIL